MKDRKGPDEIDSDGVALRQGGVKLSDRKTSDSHLVVCEQFLNSRAFAVRHGFEQKCHQRLRAVRADGIGLDTVGSEDIVA